MSAVETLLPLRAEERELLSARVLVSEERYAVLFTVRDARAVEGDYVRFALHYYARVLFELVRTARSSRDLPMLIDRIVAMRLSPHTDLFAIAGVSGSLARFVDDPHALEADCVLASTSHRDFHLRGDFSRLTSRALIGSVIAVLQSVVQHIPPEMVDVLATALANMNASYGVTHRYSEANSLDEVPVNAYHAASFV
jgi:hypothetical protein